MKNIFGFTLVEIMIALAVFALVAVAAQSHIGTMIRGVGNLEERTFSTWIAQNQMAALRLEQKFEQGQIQINRRDNLDYANRKWYLNTEVLDTKNLSLKRVEVSVCLAEGECQPRLTGFLYLESAGL